MKNKQVKQMICRLMEEKFDMHFGQVWFEDGRIMIIEPPCGYSEDEDEIPLLLHWELEPFYSLTAEQLK